MSATLRSFFRASFLLSSLLIFLGACATDPKTLKKPYEFCYCGAMKGPDNKDYCGIWADRKRLDVPHNALGTVEQNTCTPEDCSKNFSSSCERMQMWAYEPVEYPKPSAVPCYCDSSLVENDKGQITLVCAAWQQDSDKLLEYYVTKDCKPETCGKDPFQIAGKLCPQGFRGHYLPFPKTSTPPMPVK
ncbi:MAG: hypothetical protein V4655_03430 [Bdellovibrionota bacterium]